MTTVRIGRPPAVSGHRVKRTARWMWRHAGNVVVYWLAMTGAMVATVYGGVRLVVAVTPHAQAPLNFTEWTVAIVAVGSLVGAHLLSPRPKRRTKTSPRPTLGSGAGKAGPAVEHVSAARRRLRPMWRWRRTTPGLIPSPPVGG